jgi:peptidoglycan/LPS O-acetylase OafA/YrhL
MASIGGLIAIVLACILFNSETPFPGTPALLPTIGAAAFIWAQHSGVTSVGQLLGWKPFVFVGQISYSLYLLHWPLLVFTK